MKFFSAIKRYRKLFIGLMLASVLSATVCCSRGVRQDDEVFLLISEMEISLLQCRRAEKNFLLRHDLTSVDSFVKWLQALKKHDARMRSVIKDKAILGLLDDIDAETVVYENAFQDIKGLYDSKIFGPVHDPALSKITDEVTLMREPAATPSSADTTRSLVEAARNLEYYINILPTSSPVLIATLTLRRWEKNLLTIHNRLGTYTDSIAIFYRKKIHQELSNLNAFIEAEDSSVQKAAAIAPIRLALRQYELNFDQLISNQDSFFFKKKTLIMSTQKIENNIQMIKINLTPASSQIYTVISGMEISLLQCRRAEKNFLLRHDPTSVDSFIRWLQALKKYDARMRSVIKDKAILGLLDDIDAETVVYENTFQDVNGLYDSKNFGPVHDPAFSKITDEVTLMREPAATPLSADTTRSLVEAARNLEYYINISPESSTPLLSILQARRWEKNFQLRYDGLTGSLDSQSILYIRKTEEEASNIKEWLLSEEMKGRSGAEFTKLYFALEQYKYNLGYLARNADAFYIKTKEMIRFARDLDRSIQMIKQKVHKTTEESEIGGIYYLTPKLPIHGQPEGNYHDVGSLLVSQPSSYDYRYCKNWLQFDFDQDGLYTRENLISSIYYHIWIRTVNNSIDLGYERDGKYSGGRGAIDDFISINYDNLKGYSTRSGCSLITGKVDMDCSIKGEDIYKFTIKLLRHSGYPTVAIEPNQYSFIIFNPPCDSILKSTDSDGDGFTDHEEMFVYYTNPYDGDTDGDGFSDRTEALKGMSPNINNLYSGGVIDGVNDTPHIDYYQDIDGDWIVDKEERYVNSKFTLHGNLFINNGGFLTLDNCILYMNKKARNKHIYVDKGGTLNLRKTDIELNETGYWHKIVEGEKVEKDSDFDIYGTLNLHKSVIKNSLGIKVHQGSKMAINDSRILNCYHLSFDGASDSKVERSIISTFIGIPIHCKSSSPIIRDTILSVEYAGVGIYCFDSSPSIYNSKIIVCEDDDSDSPAFILVASSHPVLSNTDFNKKRVSSDNTSSIVFK